MMEPRICVHCGVEFSPSLNVGDACPICADDRVAKPPVQRWTTMTEIAEDHANDRRELEAGLLTGIGITPAFGIGQRAILVEQRDGCVLFDCVPFLDADTHRYIAERRGLKAIVPSHPHFYGAMVSWSKAFGGAPIYVHELDREWIMYPSESIRHWSGDTHPLNEDLTLIRCGGHFDGGTVLHVAQAANGDGALLTGDVVMVTENGCGVSFMRSYPGYIPLQTSQVRHIANVLQPYRFQNIYGAWWNRVIERDGSGVVARATERYLQVLVAS